MKRNITAYIKKNTVLVVSAILAISSVFIVPPNKSYFQYIDFGVLALLFCLMLVVAGFKQIGVFDYIGKKMLSGVKNTRQLVFALVFICFFSSMFITNDVALIAFVPFTVLILKIADKNEYLINVIVLQTVAANLGSMLTPIGNPHNLYIYSAFKMPIIEFFKITVPLVIISAVIIAAFCAFMKNQSINTPKSELHTPKTRSVIDYSVLFIVCLMNVLRVLSWQIMLIIVVLAILIINKKLFRKADYELLLTFVCFFIFIGNIGQISEVKDFLQKILDGNELAVTVGLSQVISNVPASVLLSKFTNQYRELLIGVNLGGLGTIIASLASLISYKQYAELPNAKLGKYLFKFTLINVSILAILLLIQYLFKLA